MEARKESTSDLRGALLRTDIGTTWSPWSMKNTKTRPNCQNTYGSSNRTTLNMHWLGLWKESQTSVREKAACAIFALRKNTQSYNTETHSTKELSSYLSVDTEPGQPENHQSVDTTLRTAQEARRVSLPEDRPRDGRETAGSGLHTSRYAYHCSAIWYRAL